MFRSAIGFFVCTLVALAVGGYAFVVSMVAAPLRNLRTSTSTVRQYRHGVCKDFWVSQLDGSRLHDRLESASSILTLESRQGGNLVEELSQVRCFVQDKILASNGGKLQQLRLCEANTGLYDAAQHKFQAQAVNLSLFRLPGTALPITMEGKTPYLKGRAREVTLTVSGSSPHLDAQHFEATLLGRQRR